MGRLSCGLVERVLKRLRKGLMQGTVAHMMLTCRTICVAMVTLTRLKLLSGVRRAACRTLIA